MFNKTISRKKLKIVSTNITVRSAIKEDQLEIGKLVRKERLNPIRLNWKRFIIAVEPGGRVIGCSQIKPQKVNCYELASLVIHPDFRGQGIARMIIECQLNSVDEDLYLMCRESLGDFYRIFGFVLIPTSEMPRFFRRVSRFAHFTDSFRSGEGLLIMRRKSSIYQEQNPEV